ncbi:MAG: PAS domain S-box protein, partial [Thermoplasmata archaeon]|nr:PAS domain S-box protein [Thermoplasmata archaeon]
MPGKKRSNAVAGSFREALERHVWLFDGIPDGITVLDPDGTVLYANEVVVRRRGIPLERLVGLSALELYPSFEPTPVRGSLEALRKGQVQELSVSIPREGGSKLHFTVTATPILIDGVFVGSFIISRDVSDTRRIEEELAEKEKLFRDLADNAPVGVAIVQDYEIKYINRAGAAIVGCSVDEVLAWGRSGYLDHVHPDDLPFMLEQAQRRQRCERDVEDDYTSRYIHRSGDIRWVDNTITEIVHNGAPAMLAILLDVTERRAAEEALKESEERYRSLVDLSPDAVVILQEGIFRFVNREFTRLFGYTEKDVKKGLSFMKLVREKDVEAVRDRFEARPAGKPLDRTFSIDMVAKDGAVIACETAASPIEHDGRPADLVVIRDLRERILAQRALERSEEQFRVLSEESPSMVFLYDFKKLVYVNRRVVEVTGYSMEELLDPRLDFMDLVHPDSRETVAEDLSRAAAGEAASGEYRIVTRDGSVLEVVISSSIVDLEGGKGILGIATDVTKINEAKRSLAFIQARFESLGDRSPNMIFIYAGGRVAYVNQRGIDVMGYSREEFLAPDFDLMSIIAPEHRALICQNLARHARGEDLEQYGYAILTKGGARLDTMIATKLVEYEGERAILGIVTDITALRSSEREMAESEERFRTLFELSEETIVVHDLEGRILEANGRATEAFGFAREELLEMNIADVHPPASRGAMAEALERIAAGGAAAIDVELARRDGSTFPAHVSAAAIQVHGKTVVQAIVHDLTARRAAEEALQRSEEFYRTTIDAMTDPMHIVDRDLNILLFNRPLVEWTRRYGIAAEFEGANLRSVFPFLPSRVWDEYAAVFADGKPLFTVESTALGGTEHTTRTSKIPVLEADGSVSHVIT